jgi:aryl-alcohol dehydrogenase-like predicted oxidoreductase
LHAILEKLHRKASLTAEEVQQLCRQIEDLGRHDFCKREEANRVDPAIVTTPTGSTISGHATREGVQRFAGRFGVDSISFYNPAQDILISSIGIGTYRGAMDNETDASYAAAVHAALLTGLNVIDTSINYRHQRSERSVGVGIKTFLDKSGGSRDEIVVCTKGGYLVSEAITPATLGSDDVVGGSHSMAPAFVADQIERSRRNLGLGTIDVYYLHNPETQLQFVEMAEFMRRIRGAFELLERAVSNGFIQYYGTATWNGYRDGSLSLRALAETACQVAGEKHHFRFVQLPFNVGMQEALTPRMEGGASVLALAAELGITVIASAALLHGRLARDLPPQIVELMPGLKSDAQRAIQFTRCTPGIASVLVGMRGIGHVEENLAVAKAPRLTSAEYQQLRAAFF